MCIGTTYVSPTCKDPWLSLVNPCLPSRNLSNCPRFQDGSLAILDSLPPFQRRKALQNCCPHCDLPTYDPNATRIIEKYETGWKFGFGSRMPKTTSRPVLSATSGACNLGNGAVGGVTAYQCSEHRVVRMCRAWYPVKENIHTFQW